MGCTRWESRRAERRFMLPSLCALSTKAVGTSDDIKKYWINVANERAKLHNEWVYENSLLFHKCIEAFGPEVEEETISHSEFRFILLKFKGLGVELTKEVMDMVNENDWATTWDALLEFFGSMPPGVSGFGSKQLSDKFEEAAEDN